jgi:tRNA A-37 threonylcarbamoyl transferase component Bud32
VSHATERLSAALDDRYRIERALGAGGMATVYLAYDVKHDRRVALKVLKPELAAVIGAERFVVEIKTTAALQHPHILPLFDSGSADGFLYYVMPYVEGETLRAKLDRERQFGVDEAVRIAREVADALDYAHRHGVVHRDIKPENILLHDGRPMVADFGIALALSAAAGGRMTETGLSLGTPHYMSPEQATAEKEITGRSDVYSLGSVLYEMLTGDPPHTGSTAQQIIMKIIADTPRPVTDLRRSVPPHVADAVARALEKLPADRFESAKAFAGALGDPGFTVGTTRIGRGAAAARAQRSTLLAMGALAAVLALLAAWGWLRPAAAPATVHRYLLAVPDSLGVLPGGVVPVVGPGGSFIAYLGPSDGNQNAQQIWIKHRDRVLPEPVAGSLGAVHMAASPDGEWLAFTSTPQVRKVRVAGGPSEVVVANGAIEELGLAWLEDGRLIFVGTSASPNRGVQARLMQVPSSGGTPTVFVEDSTRFAVLPNAVPGGAGVLLNLCSDVTVCDLYALKNGEDTPHLVVANGVFGQATRDGLLVYERGGVLLVGEFDLKALTLRGESVAIPDRFIDGGFAFRVSPDGTLLTIASGFDPRLGDHELVWVDRGGRVTPVDTTWRFQPTVTGTNHGLALSPDGSRVAVGVNTEAGDHIWVKDVRRAGTPASRVTFEQVNFRPRWSPDGRLVTFVRQGTQAGITARRADGAGTDSVLVRGLFVEGAMLPSGWKLLRAGGSTVGPGGRDISGLAPNDTGAPRPLLSERWDEHSFTVSPDGRWLMYVSDETGRAEVYVRPFPDLNGGRWQVSASGGFAPLWARTGREIFYLSGDQSMVAVPFASGATPTFGAPTPLFRMPSDRLRVEWVYYAPWDIAPDGRFIMARQVAPTALASPEVIVAEHASQEWRRMLRR